MVGLFKSMVEKLKSQPLTAAPPKFSEQLKDIAQYLSPGFITQLYDKADHLAYQDLLQRCSARRVGPGCAMAIIEDTQHVSLYFKPAANTRAYQWHFMPDREIVRGEGFGFRHDAMLHDAGMNCLEDLLHHPQLGAQATRALAALREDLQFFYRNDKTQLKGMA